MKLIVGLGNPGKEYEKTRHNVGFSVIDFISEKKDFKLSKTKFNGEYEILNLNGEKVIVAKPKTFMNNSGSFVKQVSEYYDIEPKDILVFVDDKDIEIGKTKIRFSGSSAGQNGIKDIINQLGTEDFGRVRIGISNGQINDTTKFVLGNFSKEDKEIINSELNSLMSIAEDFLINSPNELMNKHNG